MRDEHVFDRIAKAIAQFQIDTGKKPEAVYLGMNEWGAVQNSGCLKYDFIPIGVGKPENRIMGIRCYQVRDYDHIGVGA